MCISVCYDYTIHDGAVLAEALSHVGLSGVSIQTSHKQLAHSLALSAVFLLERQYDN